LAWHNAADAAHSTAHASAHQDVWRYAAASPPCEVIAPEMLPLQYDGEHRQSEGGAELQ
jgi:hypothetical protein